jgi:hypothetical protein
MVYLVVGLMKTDLRGHLGFPALVFVASYLMTIFGFSYEAEESRKVLLGILEGGQREPNPRGLWLTTKTLASKARFFRHGLAASR